MNKRDRQRKYKADEERTARTLIKSYILFPVTKTFVKVQLTTGQEIQWSHEGHIGQIYQEWGVSVVTPLSLSVSPGTTSRDVTNSNLIQLAIIMVTLGAFLAEAWLSQKESPHGSRWNWVLLFFVGCCSDTRFFKHQTLPWGLTFCIMGTNRILGAIFLHWAWRFWSL